MPERIIEAALSVLSPRRFVVAYGIERAVRTCRYGTLHEDVWVVDEDLDPHGCRAYLCRAGPPVVLRFGQEERGARNLQAHNRPQAPQLRGTKGTRVPAGGRGRVRHRQHERNNWSAGFWRHDVLPSPAGRATQLWSLGSVVGLEIAG